MATHSSWRTTVYVTLSPAQRLPREGEAKIGGGKAHRERWEDGKGGTMKTNQRESGAQSLHLPHKPFETTFARIMFNF